MARVEHHFVTFRVSRVAMGCFGAVSVVVLGIVPCTDLAATDQRTGVLVLTLGIVVGVVGGVLYARWFNRARPKASPEAKRRMIWVYTGVVLVSLPLLKQFPTVEQVGFWTALGVLMMVAAALMSDPARPPARPDPPDPEDS